MDDAKPEDHTLSDVDRKICEDLADWYWVQNWEEGIEPSRIKDKKAWDQKVTELAKMDVAKDVCSMPIFPPLPPCLIVFCRKPVLSTTGA